MRATPRKTAKEISKHLGLTVRRVHQLVDEGILPEPDNAKRFDLDWCDLRYSLIASLRDEATQSGAARRYCPTGRRTIGQEWQQGRARGGRARRLQRSRNPGAAIRTGDHPNFADRTPTCFVILHAEDDVDGVSPIGRIDGHRAAACNNYSR